MLAALDDYYRNHNANIHRGVYTLAQEADALFEGARDADRGLRRLAGREHDLHAQRDRGDQPRRLLVGAHEPARPATRC